MNTRSSMLLLYLHFSCNYQCWKCVDILYSILKKARDNLCRHFITKYKIPVILWTVSSKDVRKSNQVLSDHMLPSRGWHSWFLFGTCGFKPLALETGYRGSDISSASPVLWQEITYTLNYPKLDHWRLRPHLVQFIIC
jgi:hypothetical protein